MACRPNARYFVPATPIIERVAELIEELHYTQGHSNEGDSVPTGGIGRAEELLDINWKHLRQQTWLTFDVADRILCKLDVNAWRTDPRLRKCYYHPLLPNAREIELEEKVAQKRARRAEAQRRRRDAARQLAGHAGAPTNQRQREQRLIEALDVLEAA